MAEWMMDDPTVKAAWRKVDAAMEAHGDSPEYWQAWAELESVLADRKPVDSATN